MNLMFWKKKTETGNNAEDAQRNSSMNKKGREPLDFAAAKRGLSESNPESPNPESPGQEAPVKTGLVARMKSKFTSFARHFSKAPAFQAGEDYVPNVHDSSKPPPNEAPDITSDQKSADPGTPAKPGLAAQIISRLAALTLRFNKAPAPDAEESQDKDTRRRSRDDSKDAEETPEKTNLVGRVKTGFVAFISHHKKLLIFTLLFLSLAGIVYAAWNIIFPPLVRKPTLTGETAIHEPAPPEQTQNETEMLKAKSEEAQVKSPQAASPQFEQPQTGAEALKAKSEESQAHAETPKKEGSEQPQTEAGVLKKKSEEARARAETLKKESEEAQTQAETLKKESEAAQARADAIKKKNEEEKARIEALKKLPQQQQPLDSPARQTGGSTAPALNSGEITVGSKDPKAAAKSLKEAIEAMNSGSDVPPKKPAK